MVAAWSAHAAEHGHSLPQLAVAFASLPSAVSKIVLGIATPEEVSLNVASVEGVRLSAAPLNRCYFVCQRQLRSEMSPSPLARCGACQRRCGGTRL